MSRIGGLFLLLTICVISVVRTTEGLPSALVVIQDTETSQASIKLLDLIFGRFYATSPLEIAFPWPLVETTYDAIAGKFYVVTYPLSNPAYPDLYQLQNVAADQLNVTASWLQVDSTNNFFDLQFSEKDLELYGITVTSPSTRSFARFKLTATAVKTNPIGALPPAWYVNASSFDQKQNQYFALLNQLPSANQSSATSLEAMVRHFHAMTLKKQQKQQQQADKEQHKHNGDHDDHDNDDEFLASPFDQQMMSVSLSSKSITPTFTQLPPVSSSGIIFTSIAHSSPMGALYGIGWQLQNQTTVVARFSPDLSSYQVQWTSPLPPGPLLADHFSQNLFSFANNPYGAGFSVVQWDLYNSNGPSGSIKTNYPGNFLCAAATFFEREP